VKPGAGIIVLLNIKSHDLIPQPVARSNPPNRNMNEKQITRTTRAKVCKRVFNRNIQDILYRTWFGIRPCVRVIANSKTLTYGSGQGGNL